MPGLNSVEPSEGTPYPLSLLPENWVEMTADAKYQYLAVAWSSPEVRFFEAPDVAEKYKQRAQRWLDVVALKEPDQVPVVLLADGIILENAGNKPVDSFYNHEKAAKGLLKFHEDYDCTYLTMSAPMPGRAFDSLGYKLIRWPGSTLPTGLSDEMQFQYVEDEYMRADEYDQLIENPDGYLMRTYLPRICDGLRGLEMMPSLYNMVEAPGVTSMLMPIAVGPVREALEALLKAADQALADIGPIMRSIMKITGKFGTPSIIGGATFAPFDILGDTMRCTRGIMLDMFRRPEKVIAACEALVPISVQMAVQSAMMMKNPFIAIPLHKGADGFMSNEQFARFYWPSLKAQMLALIDAGLIPFAAAEGGYNDRLDFIAESGLPAGKTVWMFDKTDMKAAKEKFGGFACIGGNVPASLFSIGTAQMMEDYCKKLLDIAAPAGGFFLSPGAIIDQAKPENIRAYLDSARKFGGYHT